MQIFPTPHLSGRLGCVWKRCTYLLGTKGIAAAVHRRRSETEAAAAPEARAYVDWLFSADAVRAAALTGTHSFQKVLFCLDSFASPPADKCSTPGLDTFLQTV